MIRILNQYVEGHFLIIEYTRNGSSVSHFVRQNIGKEGINEEIAINTPTLEERLKALEDATNVLLGL